MSDRVEHIREFARRVITELRFREYVLSAVTLEIELEDRERRKEWYGFRGMVERYDKFARRPRHIE